MKICEDCIKKDVCRYKTKIEKWAKGKCTIELPEPITPEFVCKYKEVAKDNSWLAINSDTTYAAIGKEGKDWHYTYAN